ncbi:MAG TPA: MFS transporter [Steroidobacteraceae bacterium]|nr:MFS transporter [Steroidobacteraceae bacterium]HQW08675.1 MFS transporter [Steroidobacteraceae bacterium]HQX77516.1 MFS transporter [Steroidobacteraceae bacterium]
MTVPSSPRLGLIWLADDVTRGNALTFLYAAFFSVCLLSFLSFMQPFVLDAHLGIPRSQQGRATFLLGTAQEIAMLLLVGPFGALADKLGRRVLYTLGLVWVGVGYILYPLADSLLQLVATRFFFAVGAAMIGTAMATVLADTPRDRSRGLLVAATGVLQGLGVMFGVLVLSKLPLRFESLGHSDDMAGRYTLWIGAALCFVTAAVCWLGLHRGTPGGIAHRRESLLQLLGTGLRTARANRRLALGYLASFVARGDMVVIGTFFSLWLMQVGVSQGMTRPAAMAKAGMMYGVAQLAGLAWGLFFGWLMDRLDRVTLIALAMGLAALGYSIVGLSHDPFAPGMMPKMILLGAGELSCILAVQALLGQQAPSNLRGSVMGLAAFTSALGVLFATSLGGWLFDHWRAGGPFVMIAIVNAFVMLAALWVRFTTPTERPAT